MRVLDLGAHDGFVTTWLAQQDGVTITQLDGVELHSFGVSEFNRRLDDLGIDGRCVQGMAEDAPDRFPERSYDAVVAFEIIEHVPDVDYFLYRIEKMVAPDGRIYLSTPDGTFGTGNNPHHLRAYRALDLVELARRRGEVHDMTVGQDTVSVISYTPTSESFVRPEVAIWCGPGWKPWTPLDMENGGLGGSETAAVRLALALHDKGHTVTVYSEIEEPMAYKQVVFRPWQHFDSTEKRDIVIASRAPGLVDGYVNADKVLLWMHDTDYGPEVTPERIEKFDKVMVLSEWQRNHVVETYPWIDTDKIFVTRNGIEPSYFETIEHDLKRNPHRAIYSSSPDRGLDFILDLWPQVRERVPDAELYYCYSDVYDAVAKTNPDLQKFRASLNAASEQPGVVNLGSLPQNALALAMRESGVWLAPSWCSPANERFHETYCIGAVEAAAAGCHLILSNWGGLAERVSQARSFSLLSATGDKPDAHSWVEAIVDTMTIGYEAPPSDFALASTWGEVALDFMEAWA